MRILLVDDERLLLSSISRGLRQAQPAWEIATANDGAKAMEILRAMPVDILVTDIHMPGMGGMALLSEIRRDSVFAHIPLIFITANTDRAAMRHGMASGADDYLTKPFSLEELLLAIEGRLRRLNQGTPSSPRASVLREELGQMLTEREVEVLSLIGNGLVTKEIAENLKLSPRTVSVHRANIMRKLDLHNAAALAIRASVA